MHTYILHVCMMYVCILLCVMYILKYRKTTCSICIMLLAHITFQGCLFAIRQPIGVLPYVILYHYILFWLTQYMCKSITEENKISSIFLPGVLDSNLFKFLGSCSCFVYIPKDGNYFTQLCRKCGGRERTTAYVIIFIPCQAEFQLSLNHGIYIVFNFTNTLWCFTEDYCCNSAFRIFWPTILWLWMIDE